MSFTTITVPSLTQIQGIAPTDILFVETNEGPRHIVGSDLKQSIAGLQMNTEILSDPAKYIPIDGPTVQLLYPNGMDREVFVPEDPGKTTEFVIISGAPLDSPYRLLVKVAGMPENVRATVAGGQHVRMVYDLSQQWWTAYAQGARPSTVVAWRFISVGTTAAVGNGYMMTGDITLTLPDIPMMGDVIGFRNLSGTQTIARNGNKIEGAELDLVIDVARSAGTLAYQGPDFGWVVVTEIGGSGKALGTEAVVIAVEDWTGTTATKAVAGVTATSVLFIGPAPASYDDYADAEIRATGQAAGEITFECTTAPTAAVTVNVVIGN
jgi:hypothetical protein